MVEAVVLNGAPAAGAQTTIAYGQPGAADLRVSTNFLGISTNRLNAAVGLLGQQDTFADSGDSTPNVNLALPPIVWHYEIALTIISWTMGANSAVLYSVQQRK
jgi:hypothetical protein